MCVQVAKIVFNKVNWMASRESQLRGRIWESYRVGVDALASRGLAWGGGGWSKAAIDPRGQVNGAPLPHWTTPIDLAEARVPRRPRRPRRPRPRHEVTYWRRKLQPNLIIYVSNFFILS